MWTVEFESMKVQKEVEKLKASGEISESEQKLIAAWIRQVQHHGPESVQGRGFWDDHALDHEWSGYRASCFGPRGRIIYRIEGEVVKVKIARVTNKHNYRK